MKRILLAAGLAALVSGAALATVVSPNPQQCQIPGACVDLAQVANGIPGISFTAQPGAQTAVTATAFAFYRVPRSVTVDTIAGSALTFTCTVNPQLNFLNCGTSTTCASPTTIGSVTVTAASTEVDGAVTTANALVPAGNLVAWTISPGTCTVLDIAGTAIAH